MIFKSLQLKISPEMDNELEMIQSLEREKFSYLKRRRKEEIAVDCFRLGMKEFKKIHQL